MGVGVPGFGNFYGGGDLNWNRIVPGTIRSLFRGQAPVIRSNGCSFATTSTWKTEPPRTCCWPNGSLGPLPAGACLQLLQRNSDHRIGPGQAHFPADGYE